MHSNPRGNGNWKLNTSLLNTCREDVLTEKECVVALKSIDPDKTLAKDTPRTEFYKVF